MSGLEVCSIFCKYGVHHLTISKHFNGKVTRCAFRIKIGLEFQSLESENVQGFFSIRIRMADVEKRENNEQVGEKREKHCRAKEAVSPSEK